MPQAEESEEGGWIYHLYSRKNGPKYIGLN